LSNGSVAPSCPITQGSPDPGARVWARVQDLINSIPRATDLPSAIRALNIINNIITQINRGEPVVNNTVLLGTNLTVKGEDNDPKYQRLDWIQEGRTYRTQKLFNPDDQLQYIEIKTLSSVTFFNGNTDYHLVYRNPKWIS
jgi:hypothetical protein